MCVKGRISVYSRVLELFTQGLSVDEIAQKLHIGKDTVNAHIATIRIRNDAIGKGYDQFLQNSLAQTNNAGKGVSCRVLGLFKQGLDVNEIAQKLHIGEDTVNAHIAAIRIQNGAICKGYGWFMR